MWIGIVGAKATKAIEVGISSDNPTVARKAIILRGATILVFIIQL